VTTERPWLERQHLCETLQRLCSTQRSGTLFCVTETHDSAFVVVRSGDIIALGFKTTCGTAALPLLTGIKRCRFNFKDNVLLWVEENLPSTADILEQFGVFSPSLSSPSPALPVTPLLSIAPTILRTIVQEEANRAFGPVGALLCAEQFAQSGIPQSRAAVEQLLAAIAATTGSPERAAVFQQKVWARLPDTEG
jgi:hypothetical protein